MVRHLQLARLGSRDVLETHRRTFRCNTGLHSTLSPKPWSDLHSSEHIDLADAGPVMGSDSRSDGSTKRSVHVSVSGRRVVAAKQAAPGGDGAAPSRRRGRRSERAGDVLVVMVKCLLLVGVLLLCAALRVRQRGCACVMGEAWDTVRVEGRGQ